jgi:hypothetical protein
VSRTHKLLNMKSSGFGMVYYRMISESDDSDLFFGNKGNTYGGDEMQLALNRVAEVVKVFSRCEKIIELQSPDD